MYYLLPIWHTLAYLKLRVKSSRERLVGIHSRLFQLKLRQLQGSPPQLQGEDGGPKHWEASKYTRSGPLHLSRDLASLDQSGNVETRTWKDAVILHLAEAKKATMKREASIKPLSWYSNVSYPSMTSTFQVLLEFINRWIPSLKRGCTDDSDTDRAE